MDTKFLESYSEKEIEELTSYLKNRNAHNLYERNIRKIIEHKKYIGKCYFNQKSNQYIKILSSKSSNEYHLECMCFSFPVKFTENNRLKLKFSSDSAFSTIDFEGIYIEDYPLLCNDHLSKGNKKVIDSLKEISEEEYFNKMNEYIKELQDKVKNGYFNTSRKVEK